MDAVSLISSWVSVALQLTLIIRARQGRFLSRFPLFYSYIVYLLVGSLVPLLLSWVNSPYYRSVFWYHFMITLVVEFAVIVEISDHIFGSYPAIRELGRLVAFCISGVFLFYIIPALTEHSSSSATILDFVKRTALTKAVILLALLAAAKRYDLPLTKNSRGIIFGFCTYLAINVVNFALAETYGPALYGNIFGVVGPVSCNLAALIWVVSMWRYEPAIPLAPAIREPDWNHNDSSDYHVGELNAKLEKMIKK